jgi:hypothetical protein
MLNPINHQRIEHYKKAQAKKTAKTGAGQFGQALSQIDQKSQQEQNHDQDQSIESINAIEGIANAGATASTIGEVEGALNIDTLLAIEPLTQQVGETPLERRTRIVLWNNKALDALSQLQLQLLNGEVNIQDLQSLQAEIQKRQKDNQSLEKEAPELYRLYQDIEMRLRIEIAKRTK